MIQSLLINNYTPLKCSKREIEIIDLISKEYTTQEIANILYISPSTVDTHRRRIFRKLNVRNSAGMVRRSFELGILVVDIQESGFLPNRN